MQKKADTIAELQYEEPTLYSYVEIVEQLANGGITDTLVRDAQSLVANLPVDEELADIDEFANWCFANGVTKHGK